MVRGATFACVLAAVVVVEVLLDALLLLGLEPHPTRPMPNATIAIARQLIDAVRFIGIAPVDQVAQPDEIVGEA
jgi:hypothetical protein